MRKITNPIIQGFYPDPSICRVGDDYYLVNSSFEMYPGIPIFHSKNLVDWEQIGNVMDKDNDFHVRANSMTGGVMAPTIRYKDGIFYVINANFSDKGNFIVKTKDPRGKWSEPYWLDDIPGIDASLFIDDDGQAYIVGTGNVVSKGDHKENGIYACKFDLDKMKLIGDYHPIWQSALKGAASPEGPHLYKVNGYYYLMIAEGGTEVNHAVTIARSKNIFDWYEGDPANPVLTNRQMGSTAEFTNIGHADLVETKNGNWYAVCLGSRTIEGNFKNLGRETFMCPVTWENGWPYFSPESGKMDKHYEIPTDTKSMERLAVNTNIIFNTEKLPLEMILWGTPYGRVYKQENDGLHLYCNAPSLTQPLRWALDKNENAKKETGVSFIGRRQTSVDFQVETTFEFEPKDTEGAGLAILQASNHQYRLEKKCEDGKQVAQLVLVTTEMNTYPHMPNFKSTTTEKVLYKCPLEGVKSCFGVKVVGQDYQFYTKNAEGEVNLIGKTVSGRKINPPMVGCMAGTIVGMYATGNGVNSDNSAIFKTFMYTKLD